MVSREQEGREPIRTHGDDGRGGGGGRGGTSKIREHRRGSLAPSIPSDEWVVSGLKRSKRTPSLTDGARLKKGGVAARQGR